MTDQRAAGEAAPSPHCTRMPSGPEATGAEVRHGLADLLEVSFEAKLAHRAFAPLYANDAFARLFGFADRAEVMRQPSLVGCLDPEAAADPLRAWGALVCAGARSGEATMRRRDGAPIRARYLARPIVWREEAAVALAIVECRGALTRSASRAVPIVRTAQILVVDADAAALRRLRALAPMLGARAVCVEDVGEASLWAARARFDLVLIALDAPNLEGCAAARRFRAQGGPSAQAPIVAMTVRRGPAVLDAIAEAGMDGLLPAPAAPSALRGMISLLAAPATRSIEAPELDQVQHQNR